MKASCTAHRRAPSGQRYTRGGGRNCRATNRYAAENLAARSDGSWLVTIPPRNLDLLSFATLRTAKRESSGARLCHRALAEYNQAYERLRAQLAEEL